MSQASVLLGGNTAVPTGSMWNDRANVSFATVGGSQFNLDDFTIEFFVNQPSNVVGQLWYDQASGSRTNPLQLQLTGTFGGHRTSITILGASGSTTASGNLIPNAWNHIAFVRSNTSNVSGSTMRIYTNGTRTGQNNSYVRTSITTNSPVLLNNWTPAETQSPTGYFTNIRITDRALYSAATITVPQQPLQAVAGTQVLYSATTADQLGVDSSLNGRTLTFNHGTAGLGGDIAWNPRNPFYS